VRKKTAWTLVPIGVIIWVSRQTLVEQAQQLIGTSLRDSVVRVGKSMDEFMFNAIPNVQTMAANPDLSLKDLPIPRSLADCSLRISPTPERILRWPLAAGPVLPLFP
jgi:hypothetical protein